MSKMSPEQNLVDCLLDRILKFDADNPDLSYADLTRDLAATGVHIPNLVKQANKSLDAMEKWAADRRKSI